MATNGDSDSGMHSDHEEDGDASSGQTRRAKRRCRCVVSSDCSSLRSDPSTCRQEDDSYLANLGHALARSMDMYGVAQLAITAGGRSEIEIAKLKGKAKEACVGFLS